MLAGGWRPFRPGHTPSGEAREHPAFRLEPRLRQAVAEAIADLRLPPFAMAGGSTRPSRIRLGRILSGDQFVNCAATRDRLVNEFKGQAVEMEGAALAQVSERFGAACLVGRCLRDLAGDKNHYGF